jgi:hypothetical protein
MNRAMTKILTHTACPVIITGRMIIIRGMDKITNPEFWRALPLEKTGTYLIKL